MNMNLRLAGLLGVCCLSLSLGACSPHEDDSAAPGDDAPATQTDDLSEITVENEQALNLVARVDVPGAGSVRFYEPAPGKILIGQGGLADRRLLGPETAGMSAVEKYEHVAESAAPQTLRDASERAELAKAESSDDGVGVATTAEERAATESLGGHQKSLSSFRNSNCDLSNQSSADQQAFWLDRSGTNDFTWKRLDWVQSAARPQRGSIRFRARVKTCLLCSWGSYSSANLAAGQSWMWSFSDGLNFQFNSVVDNADGDLYDFCSLGFN